MIERKVEMEKDNVIKSIDENIVSLYLNMGWKKVNDKKEKSQNDIKDIKKTSIKGL